MIKSGVAGVAGVRSSGVQEFRSSGVQVAQENPEIEGSLIGARGTSHPGKLAEPPTLELL
jgi:hypothetical protein